MKIEEIKELQLKIVDLEAERKGLTAEIRDLKKQLKAAILKED